MQNKKRILSALKKHYIRKFAKETGNPESAYSGLWVSWDTDENKYCLRGEGLPSRPDLKSTYPNGWCLLDYITEHEANKLLGLPIPKTNKRILSVQIKRMIDDSPDSSYLGEYGNQPKSDYAIDRAHSEGCASVREDVKQAKQTLEHVQQTIGDLHNAVLATYNGTLANDKLDSERDALNDAYDEVGDLIESIDECDCGFSGHWSAREYRYFNPNHENYKGLPKDEIRKYCRQDYERMESLNRGNWCYIGIRADAKIGIPSSRMSDSVTVQDITSGGLWGIESDSEKSYFEKVEKEELADLKTQLKALGFSTRAISAAFKNTEHKED